MKSQDTYHILYGERYLIYPEWWLTGKGDMSLQRQPTVASTMPTENKARAVLVLMMGSPALDAKDKKKLRIQRIQVTDLP